MPQWPSTPADLKHTLIAAELNCGRCGYNLRGLSPLGVCPECGTDIWLTIVRTVDPAASRLPRLTNPKMVAWSILWIMSCAFFAALLLAFGPVRDNVQMAAARVLAIPNELLALAASGLIASAIIGVVMLAPPRGKEKSSAILQRLWLLGIGLLAWAVATYWWSFLLAGVPTAMENMLARLAMCASWGVALFGLDGILKVIGQRSRAYRTAKGGRQSAKAMIAAAGAAGIGTLAQGLARLDVLSSRAETYGTVLVWTSTLMLLIGLAYMLINTLWIFHALRKPPPPLHTLLLRIEDRGRIGSPP